MKAATHTTKPGRKAVTRTQRQELRRPTSSLGHAERALRQDAKATSQRLMTRRLLAVMAGQETPAEVMAARVEARTLGGVPGYTPGCSWVMPEGFVQPQPRENVLDNQDSGDLTMAHLTRHAFWADHDETEKAEEKMFEGLYPHLAEVPPVEPSRARLRHERARGDMWAAGAIMPAAATRCRWHTHVRQVLPDSDELVHLGLPSDEDEFHGRAISGPALLW